jgi:glycerol kinase
VLLAIDQGTTGTTCLVVDDGLRARGRGYREIRQWYPQPGWVEHDPEELWRSVIDAAAEALAAARVSPGELAAIGITNQRETTIVWERSSGRPIGRAIVWQDRRTAERCRELPADLIRERTGLVTDPYFSATKLEWLLARSDLPQSELAFGTVDAWLVWKLTGGRVHATDETNASRTMLLDLVTRDWDDELLGLFGVERALLPRIVASGEVVGEAAFLDATVPIAGIAGDQQAALFGQACFAPGDAKATYGTGSFVLINVGDSTSPAPAGLLKTAAARPATAPPAYALEGAVLVAGAALQWLRDALGLLGDAAESEALAQSIASSDGVVFVPALTGLGSPYWDADARGIVSGLTRGTTRAHLVRAALEAIALQVVDVVDAVPGGVALLRADGGAAANGFLMQLQADLLGAPVEVSAHVEATALGAAALAGLAVGVWREPADVASLLRVGGSRYEPAADPGELEALREAWRLAVRRTTLR